MTARVHETALVEEGVALGEGTRVWDSAHLRRGAIVGRDCIIGGKSYVADEVRIGDRVKVNAGVYLCSGVTVENGAMIAAHVVFTNDRFPRATEADLSTLRSSAIDEHTERTTVREGATVGAAAVIGPGVTIGRFAMVGMGSVVTHDVPDFHLVAGSPARSVAVVCRCGPPVFRFVGAGARKEDEEIAAECTACGRGYDIKGLQVIERHA